MSPIAELTVANLRIAVVELQEHKRGDEREAECAGRSWSYLQGSFLGPANSSQVLQGRITSIQDVVNEGVLPKAAAIGQAIAADPLIQLLQHGCNYACIESCLLAPPSTLHMEGMLGELNTPPPRLPPLLLSLSHQPHLPSLPALPLFPHLLLSGVTLAPTPAAIPAGLAFVHAAALAPLPAGVTHVSAPAALPLAWPFPPLPPSFPPVLLRTPLAP
ncbi:hypothetical protein B0H14DRAFT_3459139 [Mycena olivaceomarginata]|nr:hypothetical protein B0H14DRAFT_3459139 [Mycena olivaceomarginata]